MKTTTDISQIPGKPVRIQTNSPVRVDNVPTVPSHTAGTYHLCLLSQPCRESKGYSLMDVEPRSSVYRYMKLIRNVGTCMISLRVSEDCGVRTLTASDFDPVLKLKLIYDRRSVDLFWCRALIWSPWPNFLFSVWWLLVSWCGAPSLARGWVCNLLVQLLGLDRAVTFRSKSRRTHDHIILYHLRLPELGWPVLWPSAIFYTM
jgi:hypothetical protein